MGPRPDQFRLNYSFRLVIPFSRMKADTRCARRTYYTLAVSATATAFDEARQRALADLVEEARSTKRKRSPARRA